MGLTIGSLCSGYGGLELALRLAGHAPELAWYAENNHEPAAVMAAHWPGVPNLGDLTEITDAEPVDVATAGWPCQPVSVAGRREGIDDARWLIDDVCRVASAAGARTLVLENVAGLLTANDGDALARVCEALAREGFSRWEWCTIRAADVGAPHIRKRWFCVAYADDRRRRPAVDDLRPGQPDVGRRGAPDTDDRERQASGRPAGPLGADLADGGGHVPDSDGPRLEGQGRHQGPARPAGRPAVGGAAAPDADGSGFQRVGGGRVLDRIGTAPGNDAHGCARERFGGYAGAVERWERITGRRAPDPTEANGRHLSPRFVEWMMGLPAGHVTDHLDRRPALRVLGNGVVPQQAAAALAILEAGR